MKKLASVLALVAMMLSMSAIVFAARDVNVDGYYRNDGRYVESYHRTAPNDTVRDNYNYPGNTNPYK